MSQRRVSEALSEGYQQQLVCLNTWQEPEEMDLFSITAAETFFAMPLICSVTDDTFFAMLLMS